MGRLLVCSRLPPPGSAACGASRVVPLRNLVEDLHGVSVGCGSSAKLMPLSVQFTSASRGPVRRRGGREGHSLRRLWLLSLTAQPGELSWHGSNCAVAPWIPAMHRDDIGPSEHWHR